MRTKIFLLTTLLSSLAFGQEINFIPNGGFEAGRAKWSTYKDAAQATPVDCVGGSPALVFGTGTIGPIELKTSGTLAKAATNTQGEGLSTPITLNKAASAKIITISGSYEIQSGTYFGGSLGVASPDSDLQLYVYDVDGTTLIQPSGLELDGGVSGLVYEFKASFQSPLFTTNARNLRLCIHSATTAAAAWSVKLDSIKVGLQQKSQGPPVTNWSDFTGTISGVTLGNGTVWMSQKRNGDSVELFYNLQVGTTTSFSGPTIFPFPPGITIDSNKFKIAGGNANQTASFAGYVFDASTGTRYVVQPFISGGIALHHSANATAVVGAASPMAFATGDVITFSAMFPVMGWSSTVTMSDSADSRAVSARIAFLPQSISTGTITKLTGDTTNYDTHAGYSSASDFYQVKVPGVYSIICETQQDVSTNANVLTVGYVYLNGSNVAANEVIKISTVDKATTRVVTRFQLKSGDTVDCRYSHNDAGAQNTIYGMLMIDRISGPSQIAASERISLSYTQTSGQSFADGAATAILYSTKIEDTHGSYNTGTGVFTAPAPGNYCFNISIEFSSGGGWAAGEVAEVYVIKTPGGNNMMDTRLFQKTAHAQAIPVSVNQCYPLLAGETATINGLQNSGGSVSLTTATGVNRLSIWRQQ